MTKKIKKSAFEKENLVSFDKMVINEQIKGIGYTMKEWGDPLVIEFTEYADFWSAWYCMSVIKERTYGLLESYEKKHNLKMWTDDDMGAHVEYKIVCNFKDWGDISELKACFQVTKGIIHGLIAAKDNTNNCISDKNDPDLEKLFLEM